MNTVNRLHNILYTHNTLQFLNEWIKLSFFFFAVNLIKLFNRLFLHFKTREQFTR